MVIHYLCFPFVIAALFNKPMMNMASLQKFSRDKKVQFSFGSMQDDVIRGDKSEASFRSSLYAMF